MTDREFDAGFAGAVVAQLAGQLNDGTLAGSECAGADDRIRWQGTRAAPCVRKLGEGDYVQEKSRLAPGNVIAVDGLSIPVLLRLSRPDLALLGNVFSPAECEELIDKTRMKLGRSMTVDPEDGGETVSDVRTSFGTCFELNADELISRLDCRLAQLLGWPQEDSEGLQVLCYASGAEYKPHFDYFPPDNPGSARHLAKRGQRMATLVIYPNNVEEGGETVFPNIGLSVVPRQGHGVYFGYLNSFQQTDRLTLHGGAPVRRGEKWIATKWLRQPRPSHAALESLNS
jgi:prolyl 4-hydroxylase